MKTIPIEIWSDIACPWCYVGKRRLEAALAQFPHRDSVAVTWRAFELNPSAPGVIEPQPYATRLARKYGTSIAQAQAMVDRMTEVARGDGLDFRFDKIRPGNTFDAHRLLHLAAERGVQDAVKERLLRAYMTEGRAIGDRAELAQLAVEAGLKADEVRSVLATDRYAAEVREDEATAHANNIAGVPFYLIGHYGVSGAQPAEMLLKVLHKAWDEAPEKPVPIAEGAACGPEGCS